jgi:hypothetical protein
MGSRKRERLFGTSSQTNAQTGTDSPNVFSLVAL